MKINQKDLSFFANSPKKLRMMILNQNLWFLSEEKLLEQPFWAALYKKISKFLEYKPRRYACVQGDFVYLLILTELQVLRNSKA